MKTISANECVELLPASAEVVAAGLVRFEDLISTRFWKRGDCKRMIDEGWITAKVIAINDTPAYLLGYHFTDDGGMWIDLLQSLVPKADGAAANVAIDMIAAQAGRRYIRFYTARRGLVQFQQRFGYLPEAVLLTKAL